jgi:hypothetical protein
MPPKSKNEEIKRRLWLEAMGPQVLPTFQFLSSQKLK